MTTLTKNLFRGQGERDHALRVVEGHWPTDVAGSVYVVGPDKRAPGSHWFGEQGLIQRIHMRPDAGGAVRVEHRRVDTPVNRLRRRLPFLFAKIHFMELSPFGVTNMANTNVEPIAGRLFVGYDAGRPIEVDPETLRYLTPVGANDEWLQAAPGVLEPLCAVAAHPAADHKDQTLYFVNYTQISPPGVAADTFLARWDLSGHVERWKLDGLSAYDSIHDVKVTHDHVVFTDLPFQFEPQALRGKPRSIRNQQHTNLWIVAKADLRTTQPGEAVTAIEVQIPTPSGHLFVDYDEVDGCLRVFLQHIPLADLMIWFGKNSVSHATGTPIDAEYAGLVALSVQPSLVGRYLVDATSGEVRSADRLVDERVWGGILDTRDQYRPAARAHHRQMWSAGLGFDPELVPEEWWRLYGDATDGVVDPADLPTEPLPGTLSRVDLEAMKVAEVWTYPEGSFPSPPTFVPRSGAADPDDGYVVVVVHRDGPKEIQIFDAAHIEAGPLARATAPTFNPSLLLHSCWMADRSGPRTSRYRISVQRDIVGALRGIPGVMRSLFRMGRAMRQTQP